MWNHRLCIGISDSFGLGVPEQLELFYEIGFDGFFTGWWRGCPIKEWRQLADSLGLLYQSVHAPFGYAAKMWEKTDEADAAVEDLLACLHDCAENRVPIMVMHAYIGFDPAEPTEAGLEVYGKVIAEAERLGVKIAFENTEGENFLEALMRHFASSPAVGFCWDSGHEMCYNRSVDLLALYGKKLICTHLHDNLGIKDFGGKITWRDDLHLLPFDGIADWKEVAARLDREGYCGELTLELTRSSKPGRHENDIYAKMDITDFLAEAYKRACKIAAMRKNGAC
ncbi:MAG TPA: sugar phosphate isomerase/epimerase family protein [Bacillota bacterium]|nr:sugar phosphate isomerase/epimerase [Clostridiales bacterium]HPT85776.1 sugar phosphate isomerase/epimerase family protein [Bacillota bacterium]